MKQYLKFKNWVEQEKIQRMVNKLIVGWIFIILIFAVVLSARNSSLLNVLGISTQVEPTLAKSPTPTIQELSPTPNYIQPTLAPKVYVPILTTDQDPVISCNYQYLGTQQIKRSLCNTQFECQIGGKWYFYTSREKCTEDQKAEYDKKYKEVYDATYKALTNPSTNSNEVTCSAIGYSQERKVWTYILTPEECNSAKANASSTQHTVSLYDCTINGQVIGKMTSAECSQKMTEYWNVKNEETNQQYLQQQTTEQYRSAVSACLNRARAAGAASSSWAEACYSNPNLGL